MNNTGVLKSSHRTWAGILLLGWASLLVSCNKKTSRYTDQDVFRYNEARNITSLDPAFARNPQNNWAVQQLFNGLVQLNSNLEVVPEIAHDWEIDASGKIYTFHLRDDVYFHESLVFGANKTRKVVAQDFVYSFQRLQDPEVASPGAWVMQRVKQYTAVDDHTLRVELKSVFPAFLGILSMRYCAVVPQEAVAFYGDNFRRHPVGTGPFSFKIWKEDVKLVLRKNPKYFERDSNGQRLPYLEAISVQFIPDIQSEFMLFLQGKFDFINSLDNSYKDELLTPDGILRKKYQGKIQMQQGPYLNTEYIGIYLEADHPLMRSKALRKALSIGFDRELMIAYLRNNIGFAAGLRFIPKGLPGHKLSNTLPYQPEEARKIIDSYQKTNGPLPPISLATDANYVDICEFLQREWAKIGVDIRVDIMPTATLRQAKTSGQLQLFRASWIADYPDAENYLALFYSKNFTPFGPNYTHFKNAAYDALFEKAILQTDPAVRLPMYAQLDSLAMEEHPIIPLYYDKAIRFLSNNVKGLGLNPINSLELKTVRKE